MNYQTTFIGHIDVGKRPEGFPKTVSLTIYGYGVTPESYKQFTNDAASRIAKSGVMVVAKDDAAMVKVIGNPSDMQEFDRNMIVPLHMITHITTVTVVIPDEPTDDDGKVVLN